MTHLHSADLARPTAFAGRLLSTNYNAADGTFEITNLLSGDYVLDVDAIKLPSASVLMYLYLYPRNVLPFREINSPFPS